MIFFVIMGLVLCKGVMEYQDDVDVIIDASLNNANHPYAFLTYLTETFGARPSGSSSYFQAADWLFKELINSGFENVKKEVVEDVVHVKRGKESLEIVKPFHMNIEVVGIAPGATGDITGELITVSDRKDLQTTDIRNKIVLIHKDWEGYEEYVDCRMMCTREAQEKGALAVIIGSENIARTAQEGTQMFWGDEDDATETQDFVSIPEGSIAGKDAQYLIQLSNDDDDQGVQLRLRIGTTFEFVDSYNVIGEIVGSEFPNEIVLVAGHLDSWDVGVGAVDDGSGLAVTYEALRVLRKLNFRPKRTIRFVAFCNEEVSVYSGGGQTYAVEGKDDTHIFAYEVDIGVFDLRGYNFGGNDDDNTFTLMEDILYLQRSLYLDFCDEKEELEEESGCFELGEDVEAGQDLEAMLSSNDNGILYVSPISRVTEMFYEKYHHTKDDTMDAIDSTEMDIHVASIASMVYVIADMDEKIV